MRYMILMTTKAGTWEALPDAEQERIVAEHGRFQADLEAQGRFVCSFRLQEPEHARTVRRSTSGELTVTDGPFAETKEGVGGVYVIEADSMDEALDWARRSRFMPGANEVRPLFVE